LTSVVNTTGLPLPETEASLIQLTQAWAFATESMKGMVLWSNSIPSNCVSRLWPSISTVIRSRRRRRTRFGADRAWKRGRTGILAAREMRSL